MFSKFFGREKMAAPEQESIPQASSPTLLDRRRLLKLLVSGAGAAVGIDQVSERLYDRQRMDRMIHSHVQRFTRIRRPRETGSVLERIHVNANEPTFNRLRKRDVFPSEHVWAITADAEAFYTIGKTFAENRGTAELLQKEEIRVLVPAAGVLLSPIEIAFQLAEKSESLKRVHFTFTDIDQETYDVFDQYLSMAVAACENLGDLEVRIQAYPELAERSAQSSDSHPARKAMTFTYQTADHRSIEIVIDYELKMSGNHYFRAQSAAAADIYVFHDLDRVEHGGGFPATKEAGDIYTLLADTASRDLDTKKHFMVIDAPGGGYHHASGSLGRVVETIRGERFGCGENHLDGNYPEGLHLNEPVPDDHVIEITELDVELTESLRRHGGNSLLRAYSQLMVPAEFSIAMNFDDEGNFRLSMQRLARYVATLGSQRIKRMIQNGARETLHHFAREAVEMVGVDDVERHRYLRPRRDLLMPIITGNISTP